MERMVEGWRDQQGDHLKLGEKGEEESRVC